MKVRQASLFISLLVILVGCNNNSNNNNVTKIIQNIKDINNISCPESKFDITKDSVMREIKLYSNAETVDLGESFMYASQNEISYWISISLLNPKTSDNEDISSKNIAHRVFRHLLNPNDFELIEVKITHKKGQVITMGESTSIKYFIDSLKNE